MVGLRPNLTPLFLGVGPVARGALQKAMTFQLSATPRRAKLTSAKSDVVLSDCL